MTAPGRAVAIVLAGGAALALVGTIGVAAAGTRAPARKPACHAHGRHHCPVAHKVCKARKHHPCPKVVKKQGTVTKTTPKPTAPPTKTVTTTTTPPPLPSRLEVDENDQGSLPQPYSLAPSHNPVAAGTVQFNVYNFGQDPHKFAVKDAGGHVLVNVDVPALQPDNAVPVSVNLGPGQYTLECTIPDHATLGMRSTLVVR